MRRCGTKRRQGGLAAERLVSFRDENVNLDSFRKLKLGLELGYVCVHVRNAARM